MAADRAARYPSAFEMSEDLRRFQTGQLVSARRYSALDRARRLLGRPRALWAIAAVAVAAMAIERCS
jgi:hypothetical protein